MSHRLLGLVLLLVACGPSPSAVRDTDSGETGFGDTDAPTTPGDDDDDDTTTGTGATVPTNPGEPGVLGTLVDARGEALANYDVMACTVITCFNGTTNGDGDFWFEVAAGEHVALKTHEEVSGLDPHAVALEPCLTSADGPVDLGTVYVPDLPPADSLGPTNPQILEVAEGLELTVDEDELTAPFGVFLFEVGAARIPPEHVPTYPGLDEEVLGVWAMYPFGTVSAAPIGVRGELGVAAGVSVNLRTISPLDGTLSAPVSAVSDGVAFETAAGEGILELSYLVVSLP